MLHTTKPTTKLKITHGPPPAVRGIANTAEYAIQELVMVKASDRVDKALNCRGSSPW